MNSNVTGNDKLCKVSVIVPCFNVGRLVQPLLASIEKQDYKNFEVIFVNDGSADDTLVILKDFCNNTPSSPYQKYRFVDKKNGGPGSARNAGLDVAEGDYVFFVDGDDYLFPQSISKLAALMSEGIDVAVGSFINSNGDMMSYPHIENTDKWLRATMTKGALTLVNKMFRRNIIEQNHIRFDTQIRKSEDHLFTAAYFSCAKGGVGVTEYTVFFYKTNPLSISNISTTTGAFSPWCADSVFAAVRIYKMLEGKLSRATLKELRYDTYHKYRRVRHEAHRLNYKDYVFYKNIYDAIRGIMPIWEIAFFAVRRRLSIIANSVKRKLVRSFYS